MRQRFRAVAAAAAILLIVPDAARGQAADGHLVGTVLDQTGGSIPGSAVTVENVNTGVQWKQRTDERGAYRFNNLPVGEYTLSAESEGFAPSMLSGIAVSLNRATTANISLELGEVQTAVEVTAASAQIDTTTSTVGESFDARQALYSPSSDLALGVLNLSLQGAGVASSGGTGLGEGPSIGGQRPRNNNFMIEGVDNNDKGVTGRIVDVPNEAVAEFSLLQNQYGAEFGRSTGGQFNTVVKSGTNEIHGSLYEYFSNRHLNAIDESNKRRGILEKPASGRQSLRGHGRRSRHPEPALLLRYVPTESSRPGLRPGPSLLRRQRPRVSPPWNASKAFQARTWECCSATCRRLRPPSAPRRSWARRFRSGYCRSTYPRTRTTAPGWSARTTPGSKVTRCASATSATPPMRSIRARSRTCPISPAYARNPGNSFHSLTSELCLHDGSTRPGSASAGRPTTSRRAISSFRGWTLFRISRSSRISTSRSARIPLRPKGESRTPTNS